MDHRCNKCVAVSAAQLADVRLLNQTRDFTVKMSEWIEAITDAVEGLSRSQVHFLTLPLGSA